MNILKEYKFIIYGSLAGTIFGILVVTVGFFKMLLILLLAIIGAGLGFYFNNKVKK